MGKLLVIREKDAEQLRLAESIEGAAILLLQDGVYLATSQIKATGGVYASTPDAEKRGVKGRLRGGVRLVNYAEIVGLLLEQGYTGVNL